MWQYGSPMQRVAKHDLRLGDIKYILKPLTNENKQNPAKLKERNKQKFQNPNQTKSKKANKQSSQNKNKQAKPTPHKIMSLPKKEQKAQLQGKNMIPNKIFKRTFPP